MPFRAYKPGAVHSPPFRSRHGLFTTYPRVYPLHTLLPCVDMLAKMGRSTAGSGAGSTFAAEALPSFLDGSLGQMLEICELTVHQSARPLPSTCLTCRAATAALVIKALARNPMPPL